MKDSSKTNQELIKEISVLKQGIQNLEQLVLDHEKAEETLKESEEKYRLAFESTSDGIFTIDRNFNILSITPSVERQLGYKVEEVLNRPIQDLNILTSESLTRAVSDVIQVLSGMEITGAVYEFIAKDGTRKIGEVTGTSIIREGRIIGVTAIVRDITERKRVEKEIQTLARFPSENPDPVLRIARDGTLLYINQAGLSLLPEWHLQVGQSVPSMMKAVVSKALNSGSALLLDLEQRERMYSFFITPIADEGYTNMYGRDITERHQAEESLLESESRYRTLVENASDIVFRTDETGHLTFVNPAALRITGYEEKEIIGAHYPTLIRQDMREEAIKFFGIQFVKGIPNTYSEYPVIVKGGREIWLGQNTQLIFQDGKVVAFQAVARDITERKRIWGALQDSENRYRELSIIDDLTQLYNSRHFYHQLKIELDRSNRYKQPLTLLLLDLDNFKAFNDAYGHVEGDQVLLRLGQVVKRCVRQTDSGYRYGGEEFTLLLPMTTSADGAVTAERIRTEFKKETFSPTPGQEVHVTVSIGLAQYRPQEEMKVFVHRVDQLMYQGKKNGKDRVCSEP